MRRERECKYSVELWSYQIVASAARDPSVGKMTDRTNWEELEIFHVGRDI